MRKLIAFCMITAGGYFEGENADISWHRADEEVNEFMIAQMKTGDTLLFGRKTFEVMENYWPTKEANDEDPLVAGMMSRYPKIVFSTTRAESNWMNTEFLKGNISEEIKKRKRQEGKICLFLAAPIFASR